MAAWQQSWSDVVKYGRRNRGNRRYQYSGQQQSWGWARTYSVCRAEGCKGWAYDDTGCMRCPRCYTSFTEPPEPASAGQGAPDEPGLDVLDSGKAEIEALLAKFPQAQGLQAAIRAALAPPAAAAGGTAKSHSELTEQVSSASSEVAKHQRAMHAGVVAITKLEEQLSQAKAKQRRIEDALREAEAKHKELRDELIALRPDGVAGGGGQHVGHHGEKSPDDVDMDGDALLGDAKRKVDAAFRQSAKRIKTNGQSPSSEKIKEATDAVAAAIKQAEELLRSA